MNNRKNLCSILVSGGVLLGLSALAWFRSPDAYSMSERRSLAQKPALSTESVESGTYMNKFESYALDQFPFRDGFRSLKAGTSLYLLGQKDNHGLYSVDGHISKLEYPLNSAKVQSSLNKIREVQDTYLADTDCQTWMAVVPDKNYYLAVDAGYPAMDYEAFKSEIREQVTCDGQIELFDLLDAGDYYYTDQHWRQECIVDVAERILSEMNAEEEDSSAKDVMAESEDSSLSMDLPSCNIEIVCQKQTVDQPFYGAYAGQWGLPCKADTICYLTNEILDSCTVTSYNTGKAQPAFMYDLKKAEGRDPYELFLSGADPLLVIENPMADTDRELVVFRDSFGSSLVPLLVPAYGKITVVDLRYMKSSLLGTYVDFEEQDVLFLYSTLILNNAPFQKG